VSALRVVPVTKAQACEFIDAHHRHHFAPEIHIFSLGVADGDVLVGVATVERPKARAIASGEAYTVELTRTATDGTRNANSMLIRAAWRAARELGWERLITYTQEGETGASLRAAGMRVVGERPARGGWDMPSRPRRPRLCASCGEPVSAAGVARTLWELIA
jgi:hypothetical protein